MLLGPGVRQQTRQQRARFPGGRPLRPDSTVFR